MLKNYPVGKGALGAIKALAASSSTPAPNGAASILLLLLVPTLVGIGCMLLYYGRNLRYHLMSLLVCHNFFLMMCIICLIWGPLFPI